MIFFKNDRRPLHGTCASGDNRAPRLGDVAAIEAFRSDLEYCFSSARMEATAEG